MSYQLSAISCQPEENHAETSAKAGLRLSAGRAPSVVSNGFTLIEMVVVVAIIALLLAISVPVSTGVVNSQKARATESMFETVKSAIEVYQNERPLKFHTHVFEYGAYWDLFGPLPPSPTARLTWKPTNPNPDLFYSGPEADAKTGLVKGDGLLGERTQDKFTGAGGLIESYLQAEYVYAGKETPEAHKYPTSECLLIFLRRFSPQARTILDRIGKYMTNEDGDSILLVDPSTGTLWNPVKAEDLFELRDAWGNAVRYTVYNAGPVVGGQMFRWELRSAGADGKFADVDFDGNGVPFPFSPLSEQNQGDDVVVSGSIKVEPN